MQDKIRAVIVKAEDPIPEIVEVEDKLETWQKIVGGYIEFAQRIGQFGIFVNEEGMLHNLPVNRGLFYGDFFIVKLNDPEYDSMYIEEAEKLQKVFKLPD